MRRLCTLEVIDDEVNNREKTSNSETTPNRDVATTPESAVKYTEFRKTVQQSGLVDGFRTPCNSSSTDHVTEAEVTATNITTSSNSSSDTATEKFPTMLSNKQAYENMDKIPVPSWFTDKDKNREETGDQEEEMDDFDYLGTLDDDYLLSLFSDEDQSACAEESELQQTFPDLCEKSDYLEDNIVPTTPPVADSVPSRRTNPPRSAKQGVNYCEDNNELENILQSEYCKFTFHNLKSFIISKVL